METTTTTYDYIGIFIFLGIIIALFAFLIYLVIKQTKVDERVNTFIKSLTKEEKAIIAEYETNKKLFYKDLKNGKKTKNTNN